MDLEIVNLIITIIKARFIWRHSTAEAEENGAIRELKKVTDSQVIV